jgi:hypothetical protein
MNIAKLLERLMGMDDATWARHANPWSGWTRVTIVPLLSSANWSRVWLGSARLGCGVADHCRHRMDLGKSPPFRATRT